MQGKNGRIILLSKCAVCDNKKTKFIKEQEVSGLLSSLLIKTPSSKTPLFFSKYTLVLEVLSNQYQM